MSILGNVAGLGAIQSDWAQTDEKRADFIRNKPDFEELSGSLEDLRVLAEAALPKSGGAMTGALSVITPTAADHAASKDYVDRKHLSGTLTLSASGWADGEQTAAVSGILETDAPHYGIVYSGNWEAEKEAYALIDEMETSAGTFTFRCFEDTPGVDLTIHWEVNRGSTPGVSDAALLSLDDDTSDNVVHMVADGVTYGVNNITLNESPTEETYDFTVL